MWWLGHSYLFCSYCYPKARGVWYTLTSIRRGQGALSALPSPVATRGATGEDAQREPSDRSQEVDPGRSLAFLQKDPSICL